MLLHPGRGSRSDAGGGGGGGGGQPSACHCYVPVATTPARSPWQEGGTWVCGVCPIQSPGTLPSVPAHVPVRYRFYASPRQMVPLYDRALRAARPLISCPRDPPIGHVALPCLAWSSASGVWPRRDRRSGQDHAAHRRPSTTSDRPNLGPVSDPFQCARGGSRRRRARGAAQIAEGGRSDGRRGEVVRW